MTHWHPHVLEGPRARERVAVGGVAALAFGVQFIGSLLQPRPGYFWMTDSPVYWDNATEFFQTGRLATVFYPMGASLFLAPFAGLGFKPFSVVLWVHSALHAMNAVAAFMIVRRGRSVTPAAVAAILVAIYPPLLNYSRQLISEPWFVTSLMLGLWLIIRPGRRRALFAGLLFGVMTLVRTPGLGIAALMPAALVSLRRPKVEVLLFIAGVGLVVMTGVILASASAGRPVFLTSGVSMTVGCRSVLGGYVFLPADEQPASYISHLLNSPREFFQERTYAILNILSPWPLDSSRKLATKIMIFCSDAPVLLLSIASVGEWLRRRKVDDSMLLVVPAIGLIGFYSLLFAINRYRMPYFPPLICLAVWTLWPRAMPFSEEEAAEQSGRSPATT